MAANDGSRFRLHDSSYGFERRMTVLNPNRRSLFLPRFVVRTIDLHEHCAERFHEKHERCDMLDVIIIKLNKQIVTE